MHPDVGIESRAIQAKKTDPRTAQMQSGGTKQQRGGETSSALFPKRKMMGQMHRKAEAHL